MTDTLGPYFRGFSYEGAWETVCIARGKPEDFDDLADAPIAFTGYDKATKQEADLLCAAPDLLAALEQLVERVDWLAQIDANPDWQPIDGTPMRPAKATDIDYARDAIAKARGQQ